MGATSVVVFVRSLCVRALVASVVRALGLPRVSFYRAKEADGGYNG